MIYMAISLAAALGSPRCILPLTRQRCVILPRAVSSTVPLLVGSPSVADKKIPGVNDCPNSCLCSRNVEADYKNVRLLSQFVSQQTGMILPRTVTKVCLTKQREIAKEIKKAIQMGFMPATHKMTPYLSDPKLF